MIAEGPCACTLCKLEDHAGSCSALCCSKPPFGERSKFTGLYSSLGCPAGLASQENTGKGLAQWVGLCWWPGSCRILEALGLCHCVGSGLQGLYASRSGCWASGCYDLPMCMLSGAGILGNGGQGIMPLDLSMCMLSVAGILGVGVRVACHCEVRLNVACVCRMVQGGCARQLCVVWAGLPMEACEPAALDPGRLYLPCMLQPALCCT